MLIFRVCPLMLAAIVEQSYHSNGLTDLLAQMTSRLE
jgi:hypothetical protein